MVLELGLKSDFQEWYFQRISPRKQIRPKMTLIAPGICLWHQCDSARITGEIWSTLPCWCCGERGQGEERPSCYLCVPSNKGPSGAVAWTCFMPSKILADARWPQPLMKLQVHRCTHPSGRESQPPPPPPPLQGSPIKNHLGEAQNSTQGHREGDGGLWLG